MKIITQRPIGFQPFSISVETANEVNLLASLLGGCSGRVTDTFDVNNSEFNKFYWTLSQHADCEQALDISI